MNMDNRSVVAKRTNSSGRVIVIDIHSIRRILLTSLLVQLLATSGPCALAADLRGPLSFLQDQRIRNMTEVASKVGELPETMDIDGLDFSPDGNTLAATSTQSQEVHLWRWQEGRRTQTLLKERGSAGLYFEALRYSPDGRFLVACHSRATKEVVVRIWDAATGNIARDIDEPGGGSCNAIAFTPDGRVMIRIRDMFPQQSGNSIIVYDTDTWQPIRGLRTIPFYPNTVAVSPQGKLIVVGGRIGGPGVRHQSLMHIIDLAQLTIVKSIDAFPEDTTLAALAWSPDGTHIAAGVWTNAKEGGEVVKIFDAATGEKVTGESGLPAYTRIHALRYSPDGRYLVESSITQSIRIWDGRHQTLLQEIHGSAGSLAFSKDGQFLALGGDKKILIWKMK